MHKPAENLERILTRSRTQEVGTAGKDFTFYIVQNVCIQFSTITTFLESVSSLKPFLVALSSNDRLLSVTICGF